MSKQAAYEVVVADLQVEVRNKEEEIAGLKRMVNQICGQQGMAPIYANTEVQADQGLASIQPDTFYGQALNTSLRRILEMRKAANLGPATVREFYEALVDGGYQFNTADSANASRGLRISLGKSTHTFHKLPNGSFGLLEWYPEIKERRNQPANGDAVDGDGTPPDNGAEAEKGAQL